MYFNVATDNLYQKIMQKLNRKYFFSLRSIRINTLVSFLCPYSSVQLFPLRASSGVKCKTTLRDSSGVKLQNGSAHAVGASYSGLYFRRLSLHINVFSLAS